MFLTQEQAALAAAREGWAWACSGLVSAASLRSLSGSPLFMEYVSPSSGPSDACPFLVSSPPSTHTHTHTHTHSHTHTHTHPPGVVLRQKSDWHLSCIDLPVADTLAEPVITKQ